ncbi:hypothetical protein T310_2685 [Rasamsonia emersonii CBS 393.64]|uniref:Rad51 family DNA repair protein n=1 Tax=Rasamsonia emersonii (strain ATCC 16479 / CBS 393.64 / IMI 116815) TaxID=1408163 RepID=A0A0F4YYU9_RASE3|nr:hypothetical protein T310_2685 [Rasamsonia emersonii CBS 393.64]KKA23260.1 hypothetical protein T310_2685 [Rasamsonia emersonii CBS 393.64]
MSAAAAALGERLLGELLHDLADQYLQSADAEGNASYLGVKQLDDLLDIFLDRGKTTTAPAQPSTRPEGPEGGEAEDAAGAEVQHPNDRPAEPTAPPAPNRSQRQKRLPVLEISSPSSGAGKTQLLYYLAAIAVLPPAYRGIPLGGREAAIVLLDSDGRFDADRLWEVAAGIVQQKVKRTAADRPEKSGKPEEEEDADLTSLLHNALQHVHVFRPQSSSALLSTLQTLDGYLFDLNRHVSAARPLHAIMLDSASAFYWQDRLRDEVARTEDIGRSPAEIARDREQNRSFHLTVLYRELVAELRRLQTCFDCAIVYTTWGVSRAASSLPTPYATLAPGPPSFRPHLPPPWGTFPTLRLVVQRDAVRPFGPETTVAEAERDAPIRQEVVQRGKFSAWVDPWGREEWPLSVLNALNRMPERGGFPFWVRREGVFMSNPSEARMQI